MINREIKFRIWTGKRFEYDEYFFIQAGRVYEFLEFGGTRALKDATLQQFTGLKDKNGKEIYEGDIISQNDIISEICFYEGKYLSKFKTYQVWVDDLFSVAYKSQIIGNIFENPNFLNASN